MKKFFMGLMLSCAAMFSFSVVGRCMIQQTKDSVYLLLREDSWFKSEVEQQTEGNRYIKLKGDWYRKVTAPSKVIVDKRPRTVEGSSILVEAILQTHRISI
ncbi:MAG: hypothetical protein LBS28_01845 [Streptococcaceae bacterium]|jgi:hypothetical protein|nr:hypothetical protein [Streptococcaceae bacterium]